MNKDAKRAAELLKHMGDDSDLQQRVRSFTRNLLTLYGVSDRLLLDVKNGLEAEFPNLAFEVRLDDTGRGLDIVCTDKERD